VLGLYSSVLKKYYTYVIVENSDIHTRLLQLASALVIILPPYCMQGQKVDPHVRAPLECAQEILH
jgi:hypothetical protein